MAATCVTFDGPTVNSATTRRVPLLFPPLAAFPLWGPAHGQGEGRTTKRTANERHQFHGSGEGRTSRAKKCSVDNEVTANGPDRSGGGAYQFLLSTGGHLIRSIMQFFLRLKPARMPNFVQGMMMTLFLNIYFRPLNVSRSFGHFLSNFHRFRYDIDTATG